jgi:hypothetical protein
MFLMDLQRRQAEVTTNYVVAPLRKKSTYWPRPQPPSRITPDVGRYASRWRESGSRAATARR